MNWKRTSATCTAMLGLMWLAPAASSAIGITDGDVVVQNLGDFGFTSNASVLSFDGGTTDQLYQMFGYIGTGTGVERVNATHFNVINAISAVGSTATSTLELNAAGALALGLNAQDLLIEYSFELVNDTTAADIDGFTWDFQITNQSLLDLDLTFYSYLDLDLDGAGDFGDDIAVADLRQIIVSDADSPTVYHWNASNNGLADQFQIDTYPNVRNFLDNLSANDDLAGDNASFGPADFTAAYQYNFSINAGESDGNGVGSISPIPEPSTALLLMVGLATIARRRRGPQA